jgi:hypothetical protein
MKSLLPSRTSRVEDGMRLTTGNRQRRAGIWIAGLAVIAAIAATYQLTRGPKLVWWNSPEIDQTGRRVWLLIPHGWAVKRVSTTKDHVSYTLFFDEDSRPSFFRWIWGAHLTDEWIVVGVSTFNSIRASRVGDISVDHSRRTHFARRFLIVGDLRVMADVRYARTDFPAFKANYKQICNSLKIE